MAFQFTAGRFKGFAADGTPLTNGRLYTFASGTTTFKAAYTDATLGTACTYVNDGTGALYIALDARGEAQLWLGAGAYSFALKTSAGAGVWTVDGVVDPQAAADSAIRADLASTAAGKGDALIAHVTGGAAGTVSATIEELAAQVGSGPLSTNRTVAEVGAKWQAGTAISIAFEGDSLTYGQQDPGGPNAGINGSSNLRASYQMPESFRDALTYAKGSKAWGTFSITNRGYPGDNTANGVTRWAAAAVVDLVFIMYGTNDANGAPLAQDVYRANMGTLIQRRLVQGSAVVVLGPPSIDSPTADPAVKRYSGIAREVAGRFGVPFIDLAEQLASWIPSALWSDGTHLTGEAYRSAGMNLAGLLVGPTTNRLIAAPGSIITYDSGGNIAPDVNGYSFAESTSGHLWQIDQNKNLCFAVDVIEPVQVVIHCTNTVGTSQIGAVYFNGGATDNDNATSVAFGSTASNGNGTVPYVVGILRPGKRFFVLTNPNATSIFVESVRFVSLRDAASISGAASFVPSTAAIMRPMVNTASGYWAAADWSKKLTNKWSYDALMTINSASQAGLCIQAGQGKSTDYLTRNAAFLYRYGTILRYFELVNGSGTAFDTAAVFTGGVPFTGTLSMVYDGTDIKCYVDGVLKYTRATPAFTSGFPGVISDTPGVFACHSAVCTYSV